MAFTPTLIFISLTAAILVLIAVVVILEKFVSRKKQEEFRSPEYLFTEELNALKKANLEPGELLTRIDLLAKKALSQNNATGHLDYSQLAESYKEKQHIVNFCTAMTTSLYAGEKINKIQTRNLLNTLEDMLKGEGKIVLIQPKEEILEPKKEFFMDKIISGFAGKIGEKLQQKEQVSPEKATAENDLKAEQKVQKEPSIVPPQKIKVIIKKTPEDLDRKEYNYIESIDVLDRIEGKLRMKKSSAQ